MGWKTENKGGTAGLTLSEYNKSCSPHQTQRVKTTVACIALIATLSWKVVTKFRSPTLSGVIFLDLWKVALIHPITDCIRYGGGQTTVRVPPMATMWLTGLCHGVSRISSAAPCSPPNKINSGSKNPWWRLKGSNWWPTNQWVTTPCYRDNSLWTKALHQQIELLYYRHWQKIADQNVADMGLQLIKFRWPWLC